METQSTEQFDTYQTSEFVTGVDYAREQERDSEHADSFGDRESQQVAETPQESVVNARGGEPLSWRQEYAGEGKYGYENGEIINNETGESLVAETERAYGAEEAAILVEGLQQWAEGGESAIRTPDYVEDGPDKTTVYVTQYLLDKSGDVRWEIWSYSVDKKTEDDAAPTFENLERGRESVQLRFTKSENPVETGKTENELSYTEEVTVGAEDRIEAEEYPEAITEHSHEVTEQLIDAPVFAAPSEVPQSAHIPTDQKAETWLQEFLQSEPLDLERDETRTEPTADVVNGAAIHTAEKAYATTLPKETLDGTYDAPEARTDEEVVRAETSIETISHALHEHDETSRMRIESLHTEESRLGIPVPQIDKTVDESVRMEHMSSIDTIEVSEKTVVIHDALKEISPAIATAEIAPKTVVREAPEQYILAHKEKVSSRASNYTKSEQVRVPMAEPWSTMAAQRVRIEKTPRLEETILRAERAPEKNPAKIVRADMPRKSTETLHPRNLEVLPTQNIERPFARTKAPGGGRVDTREIETARKSSSYSRNGITLSRVA
jgi:hypothetical protein